MSLLHFQKLTNYNLKNFFKESTRESLKIHESEDIESRSYLYIGTIQALELPPHEQAKLNLEDNVSITLSINTLDKMLLIITDSNFFDLYCIEDLPTGTTSAINEFYELVETEIEDPTFEIISSIKSLFLDFILSNRPILQDIINKPKEEKISDYLLLISNLKSLHSPSIHFENDDEFSFDLDDIQSLTIFHLVRFNDLAVRDQLFLAYEKLKPSDPTKTLVLFDTREQGMSEYDRNEIQLESDEDFDVKIDSKDRLICSIRSVFQPDETTSYLLEQLPKGSHKFFERVLIVLKDVLKCHHYIDKNNLNYFLSILYMQSAIEILGSRTLFNHVLSFKKSEIVEYIDNELVPDIILEWSYSMEDLEDN